MTVKKEAMNLKENGKNFMGMFGGGMKSCNYMEISKKLKQIKKAGKQYLKESKMDWGQHKKHLASSKCEFFFFSFELAYRLVSLFCSS